VHCHDEHPNNREITVFPKLLPLSVGGEFVNKLTKVLLLVALICLALRSSADTGAQKTANVVLIVSDGLRWQEVFTGADRSLMNSEHGGIWADRAALKAKFWRADVSERRAALLPFLWHTVARRGQIFGNQQKGSIARVTNRMAFSYPGYNEMLTGFPDYHITTNEFGPNPNKTVFEWLNRFPDFDGRVAAYATWSTFADIFNERRSHLILQCGWNLPANAGTSTPRDDLLHELYETITRFDDEDVYDSFLQVPLLDFVKSGRARVLFVGYGETDNWAHAGRYDLVLESAHKFDHFVEQLWNTIQSIAQYRDQTTFIVTTDHGRGSGLEDWKEHGAEVNGSENIWIAVMGPDTPPLGERADVANVTQAQIAATLAAFLGKDYRSAVPNAAPAMADVRN
jgi:Metalloenzyme superfamily